MARSGRTLSTLHPSLRHFFLTLVQAPSILPIQVRRIERRGQSTDSRS